MAAAKRDLDAIRRELAELQRDLVDHGAEIRHFEVDPESPYVGKALREVPLPRDVLVISVRRGRALLIPDGATELASGDRVTVIGHWAEVAKAADRLHGPGGPA